MTLAAIGAGAITADLGYVALILPAALLAFAAPFSQRSLMIAVAAWALLPDSPVLTQISNFQVTPRVLGLLGVALPWLMGLARRSVALRMTWRGAWAVYAAAVIGGAIYNGRPQAIPLFALFAVVPYVIGCTVGTDLALTRGAIRGLVQAGIALSLVAVVEFARNKPFVAPVSGVTSYARGGYLRANAGWIHPLALGMFLALVLFLVIEELRRSRSVAGVVGALVLGAGVFATQERSPLLGIAVGAIAYVLLQVRGRARVRAGALVGVALLAILAVPGPRGVAFRQFLGESTSSSSTAAVDINDRAEILRLGVQAIRVRPIFGFGFGAAANVRADPTLSGLLSDGRTRFTDIADWPLSIAVETGLLGLAAFCTIVVLTMGRLMRSRRVVQAVSVPAMAAALVAALVTSLGVNQFSSGAFFLFALGLASTAAGRYRPAGLAMEYVLNARGARSEQAGPITLWEAAAERSEAERTYAVPTR